MTWCGTDTAAADRQPDAVSGLQWHVVYAFPADGADRFGALASGIATDLASIDAWWTMQDPTRQIRFDLHAFPGCTGFGALDLTRAQLPQPGSHYAPLATRLDRLTADLNAAPFAFASSDKKYLVFYDGPAEEATVCGQGNAGIVDGGPRAYAVVFLAACENAVGSGETSAAITAAHELTHALNALPFPRPSPGPPNECTPPNEGHACDSTSDLLYWQGTADDTLSTRVLDVNRDDYYGHSSPWWDAQDSLFLVRVGGDQTPPSGPKKLSVTSQGPIVLLSWAKATDDVGPITYRIYKDGALLGTLTRTKVNDRGRVGQTILYGLRSVDGAGNLGPLLEARFKIGLGIVDAAGKLVKDTVPPPAVRFNAAIAGGSLVLRWRAVRDPGGIRGYLVERNGRRYAEVKATSISIPLARARGSWSVRAVDKAGNVGPSSGTVRVG